MNGFMSNLVNIVHPYSYKCNVIDGKLNLVCGFIEEFKERDKKVVNFVKTALDSGVRILRHEFHPKGTLDYIIQHGTIPLCPIYGDILFDEKIIEVITLYNGNPRSNKKPEEMDDGKWEEFSELFVSDSKLKELMKNPQRTFYIGGFFEACVKNMAYHQIKNYTPEGEIFCVEELCASTNDDKTQEVRDGLKDDGIKVIGYEEAMELLQ